MKVEKIKNSWVVIEYVIDKLTEKLKDKEFDAIISVGRGGMIPARLLAEKFNIQEMYIINVKAYDKNDKFDKIVISDIKLSDNIKKVLVVDDCIFTGATFDAVTAKISENKYVTDITNAVLYKNRHIKNFKTDFIYGEDYDGNAIWLVFPWENN